MGDPIFLQDEVCYIYTLRDPRTDEVRYVGLTRSLENRKSHYRRKPPKRSDRPVDEWRSELRAQGLQCSFEIVESLPSSLYKTKYFAAERWWIRLYSGLGHQLLNVWKTD